MLFTRSVVRRVVTTTSAARRTLSSAASPWAHFEMAPPDPIIGLNEAYAKDDFPRKVIIGVGAYRDDQGKPYVLPCVREAERRLTEAGVVSDCESISSSKVHRRRIAHMDVVLLSSHTHPTVITTLLLLKLSTGP